MTPIKSVSLRHKGTNQGQGLNLVLSKDQLQTNSQPLFEYFTPVISNLSFISKDIKMQLLPLLLYSGTYLITIR